MPASRMLVYRFKKPSVTGGEADKLGNNYETLWTVRTMLRILHEDTHSIEIIRIVHDSANSIQLEPLGSEGVGVEFILTRRDGIREFHQVKRQHAQGWKISTLASAKVLSNFRNRLLQEPQVFCIFVSQGEPSEFGELCWRASQVPDVHQFEQHYLNSADALGRITLLRKHWEDCSLAEAFQLLRQIRVEGGVEATLREEVLYRAETLVEGRAENIIAALWQLAISSIRKTLDAVTIWSYLEHPDYGFRRRVWNNDPHLLQRIREGNDRYLNLIRPLDILGKSIPRIEAQQAFTQLQAPTGKQAILILGDAGSGKTGVVAQVIGLAEAAGWLTFAFRLDRLEPTPSVRQLGEQLGFRDSPATVLAEVAGNQPCLLVIDQLDAVSQTSGRHPAFFERVDELLRQCTRYPNLRVILACRQFDLQHDDRLRRLTDEQVGVAQPLSVGLLDQEMVRQIVAQCGVDPTQLNENQVCFLTTPIHLKLFTEIKGPLSFETLKDLYDVFWQQKQRAIQERMGRRPRWNDVLDRLMQRMVQDQTLSAPYSTVEDDYPEEVNELLTERILVLDGKRLSFFHETLFDYAFARRFVGQGQSLLTFLRSQEQHFFLRSIVRQILTHKRVDDFGHYLSDLRELLEAPDVRFHLKRLVFQWLRNLAEPTQEEWAIVQSLSTSEDADVVHWSKTVINSPAWFALLHQAGWIQSELKHDEEKRVEDAVNYLAKMVRDAPEEAAETLLSWVDSPEPWPTHARAVLNYADIDKARGFVDVYLKLRAKGFLPLEQPPFGHGHYLFYDLPEKRPEWAIEILTEWLIAFIEKKDRIGNTNPFVDPADRYRDVVNDLHDRLDIMARNAPHTFVEQMLPIVLELIRRNANREGESPWRDDIWPYHLVGSRYSLRDQLLEATIWSLIHIVTNDPNTFRTYEKVLKQYLEFETAVWILARIYSGNGQHFAEEGAEFLLAAPERLRLGWSGSSSWISRELLAAITPYCSEKTYEKLEEFAINYYTSWERQNPRFLGRNQLALLHAFATERRSDQLKHRLGEYQRKFKMKDEEGPQDIHDGWVGPPFNANWEKMQDDHWKRAIRKYSSSNPARGWDDFLKGGAEQLARVLHQQTTFNPSRFAKLLCQLPADTPPTYFENILRGLGESPKTGMEKLDSNLLWEALRYCHALPGRPCGWSIPWALEAYNGSDIPNDILELIAWYATEDPNPVKESWLPTEEETIYYSGDPESAGLNSVRGSMAWQISKLLFDRKDYYSFFAPVLERMVVDPSTAVRTQVGFALLPVLNIDRDHAVLLFLKLCESAHPALYGTRCIVHFLNYAVWAHFSEVRPTIEYMLSSDDGKTINYGAQLASLCAFIHPEAEPMLNECIEGSEPMRKGVAEVASARLFVPSDQAKCEAILSRLFNDPDKDVRRIASNCFSEMQGEQLAEFDSLIKNFVESVAFGEDAYAFFHALEKATVPLPDVVCLAFEKSAELLRGITPGEMMRTGRLADHNAHILIRLYERTSDQDIKRRCLDITDALARTEAAYDLERTLTMRDL